MSKILVLNSGSSSLKSTLFEFKKSPIEIAKVLIDGLNSKNCKIIFKTSEKNTEHSAQVKTHEQGVKLILDSLLENGIIKNLEEIEAVGHRVVHGGEKFKNSVQIDKKVLEEIKKISPLAPLHNPANLQSILASQKLLPKIKQVAVFDTAFYQTLEPKAYLYGLPFEYYKKHHIRRYGFHGTSHKYVTSQILKKLKKPAKVISCHLGNGSSITASINGKAIDTSMGFTPLEGIIMGTRSGSIDPAIIFHLQKNLKMSSEEIETLLIKKSGLLGLSQISSDMREIYKASLKNNKQAKLTLSILAYQIAKYIGSYAASMNGVDAIVFTGGIGEKAFYIREEVISYLEFLNFKIDRKKNKSASNSKEIISEISSSKNKIFVVKTNEELQIAEETKKL